MISSVRGTVLVTAGSTLVIEVGGIGLSITVTPQHALTVHAGAETTVHTALIVREDDLALYGFRSGDELMVFDLLRSVTGVGPKSAMGVLAVMTPQQVAVSVAADDDAAFRKVSGIGPKTAKLIVLSLAGKLLPVVAAASPTAPVASSANDNVMAALIGLGWSEKTAAQAIDDALAAAPDGGQIAVPSLLRLALSQLGPQQRSGAKTP